MMYKHCAWDNLQIGVYDVQTQRSEFVKAADVVTKILTRKKRGERKAVNEGGTSFGSQVF